MTAVPKPIAIKLLKVQDCLRAVLCLMVFWAGTAVCQEAVPTKGTAAQKSEAELPRTVYVIGENGKHGTITFEKVEPMTCGRLAFRASKEGLIKVKPKAGLKGLKMLQIVPEAKSEDGFRRRVFDLEKIYDTDTGIGYGRDSLLAGAVVYIFYSGEETSPPTEPKK